MGMKSLLIGTSAIELGAGAALLFFPMMSVLFLAGAALEGFVALTVTRVAGSGLFALGIACWSARNDTQSRTARGLVAAILFYNGAVVAILAYAGLVFGMNGIALWPGVVLHAMMTVWCIKCLRNRPGL